MFAQTYREDDGKPCKLPMTKKDVIGLSATFGSTKLSHKSMSIVRELISGMLNSRSKRRLWKLIQDTRNRPPEKVKYSGGNVVTLLLSERESFANASLSQSVLTGAYCVNGDLRNADLRNSCLREVNLTRSNLAGADLRHADLADVEIDTFSYARAVAWSPNGLRLASGHYDKTATIWTLRRREFVILERHSHWVWGLCFSPDGKFILTAGGQVKKWDAVTGKEIFTAEIPDSTVDAQHDLDHIVCVHYKPDGKSFAGGDNVGNLFFWYPDGKIRKRWRGHSDGVLCVRYSADGTKIATAGRNRFVCIWDATNGSNLAKFETPRGYNYSLVWEDDGKTLISGGREVHVWDVQNKKKTATLKTSFGETFCLAMRYRDRLLACGGSSSAGISNCGTQTKNNWFSGL
jgi:WD40 repeat protein